MTLPGIPAQFWGGPFHGQAGFVPTMPLHIAVRRCPGTGTGTCGCGRPLHVRRLEPLHTAPDGYVTYRLYGFNATGDVVYRYGTAPWPDENIRDTVDLAVPGCDTIPLEVPA